VLPCAAMRFGSSVVVILALTGCSQAYVQLPPFPDSGPQDATTADVIVNEGGEAGEEEGGTTDGGDGATDAPSDAPTDAPSDALDAGDATDAEGD
jgi:hypothetical protein